MPIIQRLSEQTANAIAAGEVVERPASVVKEVCENALDAGARHIHIQVLSKDARSLQVTDDGCGMEAEDARRAFWPHATSKLSQISDLDALHTMGFRGEALASIAAVSKVDLVTRRAEDEGGLQLHLEGGHLLSEQSKAAAVGTSIQISELFYNTPARLKFLKKESTELRKITEVVEQLALARPDVAFQLSKEDKRLLATPGNGDLHATLFSLFGQKWATDFIQLPLQDLGLGCRLEGVLSQPQLAKASRSWQFVFVNQRLIRSAIFHRAIDEAYKGKLMPGRHPFLVLKLQIPPHLVDVNVHPQKLEARFWDGQQLYRMLYHALAQTLEQALLPQGDWSDRRSFAEEAELETRQAEQKSADSGLTDLGYSASIVAKQKLESAPSSLSREAKERELERYLRESSSFYSYSSSSQPEVSQPKRRGEELWGGLARLHLEELDSKKPSAGDAFTDLADSVASDATVSRAEATRSEVSTNLVDSAADTASPKASEGGLTASLTSPTHQTQPQEEQLATPEGRQLRLGVDERGIIHRLSRLPILGQAFQTYILLQGEREIWLVDQHAAHEKILYEGLLRQQREGGLRQQSLLFPVEISLPSSEFNFVQENLDNFLALGLELEAFSANSFLLRSLPVTVEQMSPQAAFFSLLDFLHQEGEPSGWSLQQAEEALAQMACKAAIKGHDVLQLEEMRALLERLEELDQPYNCPHGRPVVIRLSQTELEKRFSRIV